MQQTDPRETIRAEVRRYLAEVSVRYVPVLAGVLAVALVIALVHDSDRRAGVAISGSVEGTPASPGDLQAGASPGAAPGATPGVAPGATPGVALGATPGSGPGGASPLASAQGATPSSATSDIAASGVKCGPGVRQMTWTPYAPPCIPKWSGSNGGATAHGVTADTITLVLRNPTDWDSTAQATHGVPTFNQIASDMQVMVNFFNTQYELYGRKVVITTFDGKGSFLAEGANQGQATANADATTAYDMGAFVDGFPITAGTYSNAEASRGIVSFAPGNSISAYKANAPYMYGVPLGPVAEIQGAGIGAVACQRMVKMKAVFAGDAVLQQSTRTFGVLEPQQPQFAGGAAVAMQAIQNCGGTAKLYQYSADVNNEPAQATTIAQQMKADNVTTAIMLTDPFMSEFMTDAASQEQYHPEWLFTIFAQAMARNGAGDEMAHAIDINPWHATNGPPDQRLCAHVFRLASHGAAPQSNPAGLDAECALLMALYEALQQSGPNLTAANFARGWFNVPDSAGTSDFGRWSNGPNHWSPLASFSVQQWSTSGTSPYDGGAGGWVSCGGAVDYPYQGANLGSGQLNCYGH